MQSVNSSTNVAASLLHGQASKTQMVEPPVASSPQCFRLPFVVATCTCLVIASLTYVSQHNDSSSGGSAARHYRPSALDHASGGVPHQQQQQAPPPAPARRGVEHRIDGSVMNKNPAQPGAKDAFAANPMEHGLWKRLLAAKCTIDWSKAVKIQLAQWQETGFTYRQVEEFCVKRTIRASLVKGELRMSMFQIDKKNTHRLLCGFWFIYMASLRAAARGDPLPNLEINLQPGDTSFSLAAPRKQWQNAAPVLGNIKCNDSSVSFPLTLHDQFGFGHPNYGGMSLQRYHERYAESVGWGGRQPFENKTGTAFFSADHGAADRGNRAAIFKLKSPYLRPEKKSVDQNYYAKYQYNIYAYGHCGWSRRIHELALMDTVVLMEHSICREFFHGIFEPGVDHIPVAEDFSDLVEKLQASVTTPEAAARMGKRWGERGRAMFSLECILDYVEALLREYARLQKFEPEYHPSWPLFNLQVNESTHFFNNAAAKNSRDMKDCVRPKYGGVVKRAHKC